MAQRWTYLWKYANKNEIIFEKWIKCRHDWRIL